jgi:hypothetical protein
VSRPAGSALRTLPATRLWAAGVGGKRKDGQHGGYGRNEREMFDQHGVSVPKAVFIPGRKAHVNETRPLT